MFAPPPMVSMAIASERMENGNIMDFVQAHQDYNRLRLVSMGEIVCFRCVDRSDSLSTQPPGWNISTSVT
jgi:hypothetical protein